MPVIDQPFRRIGMDIVGPLPRTQRGNKFVLVVCDYSTRYPEAVALPSIEAPRIARELVHIFARVGLPEEVLSDQGSNFMSELLDEIYRLLQVAKIRTSPYHPQTDGLVERFNATLKLMLMKFVGRNRTDWDEYLPYLLFAYREVPQESTGFAPFELVYGRRVRGPLDVLKESWTGEAEEGSPVADYVLRMRQRLQEMTDLVQKNASRAQSRQKAHYDGHATERSLTAGDKVLVLQPGPKRSLKIQWTGPYPVLQRVGAVDYEVEMGRNCRKVLHINRLKKWHAPDPSLTLFVLVTSEGVDPPLEQGPSTPVDESQNEAADDDLSWPGLDSTGQTLNLSQDLSDEQRQDIQSLTAQFPMVFSVIPGRTSLVEHTIHTGDAVPIRQRMYRVPYSRRTTLQKELDQMLQAGIIRQSVSPWASPVVLVPKKDGTIRVCVDFRKVNDVSKFDAYPMPRAEDVFEQIGQAEFISTLDLRKGYWQIPLEESSKEKTAFSTPFGLFEFQVLPFGLHSAPATFQRLINYVLQGCEVFARAYIDDIAVFSTSWSDHTRHLADVFIRLERAGLTLNVGKCYFAKKEICYLGHLIGGGQLRPDPTKIEAVQNYPTPTLKKDVRSFLGLAGYYRRFIPHFADLSAPLTVLTKNGQPEKIVWTRQCEEAFRNLKTALIGPCVLQIAVPTEAFLLQTDASGVGLGAVLSQGKNGEERPVAYASRKLLPRESHYAVIERECLAIVWAVKYFHVYLCGQQFTLQSDHKPLKWLQQMANSNPRLMRWALELQPYHFQVDHQPGCSIGNADGLSRSFPDRLSKEGGM